MKSLEQMIAELCPEGVPFKKLGEVCEILDSQRKPITKHLRASGIYPYYGANGIQDYVDNYLFDGTFLLVGEDGSVINKDNTPVLNWACGKIWVNNHAHVLAEKSDTAKLRFLFFALQRQNVKDIVMGTPPKLNQANLRNIEIPIPPLPIQERIVEILDKFTALTAELQAELQARQQQYEYYRNHLLSFGGLDNIRSEVADSQLITPHWKLLKMSEIFEIRNGYTPSKNNADFWDGGTIPWFRMEDIRANGRILSDSFQHITPKAVKSKGLFEKDSFIIATTATIGEHAWLIADSQANQQFTNLKVRKSLTASLMPKFVYYYLFIVDEWCKRNVNASSFASVDMDKFKDLEFPIPPLAEQQRIVDILDRFEALTSDLQSGLPAEISARQHQYEYYRNKLLTFKRKTA